MKSKLTREAGSGKGKTVLYGLFFLAVSGILLMEAVKRQELHWMLLLGGAGILCCSFAILAFIVAAKS